MEDVERQKMLVREAIALIKLYCPGVEIHYDDADCDGLCLAQDLAIAFGIEDE